MKILLTAGMDILESKNHSFVVWDGGERIIPIKELLSYKGVNGIVCGDEVYSREVMAQLLPELRVLSRPGSGIDNIDIDAADELGIAVIRQPMAYAAPVADSTMAMILMFARRLVTLNASMHSGRWERERYPGMSLEESRIGVVGMGPIGSAVAVRARSFGGTVYCHSIRGDGVNLKYLLRKSDFVTLHSRLTPETRHMIGAEELSLMKPTAYLINTARGAIVDESALLDALENKRIAGAGIDVFETEPLPKEHPFRGMDNVILSPHNAYWSKKARTQAVWNAIRDAEKELGL